MNKAHDYDAMEREYVRGDMSLRELARSHGMSNHSLVVAQSRRRDWVRKRDDYRRAASDKAIVHMADAEGRRRAKESEVRDNAIDAINEAISKLRADMADTVKVVGTDGEVKDTGVPIMRLKPQDIALLIDRLQVLFGKPSAITEERNLGLSLSAGASPELLRSFIDATRGLAPDGGAASSPIPRTDRTRTN